MNFLISKKINVLAILTILILLWEIPQTYAEGLTNNIYNVENSISSSSVNNSGDGNSSIVYKKDQRKRRKGKNSNKSVSKKDSYRFDYFIKSLAIPGWGGYDMGNRNEAIFFLSSEIALIATSITLYVYSGVKVDDFKNFAERHAGINSSSGKNENYWINIGNYDNVDAYNEQKLRNRDYANRYLDDDDYWHWDTTQNKKRFDDIRIMASTAETMSLYAVGLIAANHLLSAINASFEAGKKFETKVTTTYDKENNEIKNKLSLNYQF